MGIIDLVIIIFILFGAVIGLKQGFTKSLVSLCGFIVVTVLAFILKNPISELMMTYMPFFDFWGLMKGLSVLNIAIYELFSFLFVLGILTAALKILSLTTSVFEKLLSMTIILGIPSKILGAVFGMIKSYIIVFIACYIMSLPIFSENEFIKNSTLKDPILENTPVLSVFAERTLNVMSEFSDLSEKYQSTESSNEFNLETLELFLKYDVVKPKTVQILIDRGKLHITGADELIKKYEEE